MKNNFSSPPPIRPIREIILPEHTVRVYPNGLKLIVIHAGVHKVFRLETIFNAGRFYENKKLVAGTTLKMLKEGNTNFNAEQIADKIDFFGATLYTPSSLDVSGITLYGLNQHFTELLPLYASYVTSPIFPKKEFDEYIKERKQRLQVDVSKNDVVAYRTVTEAIYGQEHPYGYNSTKKLYNELHPQDLEEHFGQHYTAGNCTVIVSGYIEPDMIQELENEYFSRIPDGTSVPHSFPILPYEQRNQFITKENAVQTAIRIGSRIVDKNHPDYMGLYFLNVILGDYFSSRLMMNIREDKGYTYNIYSMLDMMKHDGMFLIATETANEYTRPLLKEIGYEFDRLKQEPIPNEELEMARNFTLGTLLSALDGPFNAADIIKGLYVEDLDANYFYSLVNTIKSIQNNELAELAQKYLDLDNMFTVMVGKNV